MKKFLMLTVLCIGVLTPANAQIIPYFSTTIWVEDAIGNRDSVVVGFDSLASGDVEIQYGEIEIFEPFDSILEVRAGTADPFYIGKELSKTIIGGSEKIWFSPYDCWDGGTVAYIYIWAKHQPVTVFWDKQQIRDNYCVGGALLSNHNNYITVDPYTWGLFPDEKNYCMAVMDSFIINTSVDSVPPNSNTIDINKEVEGLGFQNIYGVNFYSQALYRWTPRSYWVNTTSIETSNEPAFVVPNPAKDIIHIRPFSISKNRVYTIFDTCGTKVKSGFMLETELSVANLKNGLYFLRIEENGELIKVLKFLKI